MTAPECSRCHEVPEVGSIYTLATGETAYYIVCRKCGRKASEPTHGKAMEAWMAMNKEVMG